LSEPSNGGESDSVRLLRAPKVVLDGSNSMVGSLMSVRRD
jgi:hypothetical protein